MSGATPERLRLTWWGESGMQLAADWTNGTRGFGRRVAGWFKLTLSGDGTGGLHCRTSVSGMGSWSLLGASVHVDALVTPRLPLVGQAASSDVSGVSQRAGGVRNATVGSPVLPDVAAVFRIGTCDVWRDGCPSWMTGGLLRKTVRRETCDLVLALPTKHLRELRLAWMGGCSEQQRGDI